MAAELHQRPGRHAQPGRRLRRRPASGAARRRPRKAAGRARSDLDPAQRRRPASSASPRARSSASPATRSCACRSPAGPSRSSRQGGKAPDGRKLGVSTLGWIGIGVAVVVVGTARLVLRRRSPTTIAAASERARAGRSRGDRMRKLLIAASSPRQSRPAQPAFAAELSRDDAASPNQVMRLRRRPAPGAARRRPRKAAGRACP